MNNDILFIAPGIVIRTIVVSPRRNVVEEPKAAPVEESHEQATVDGDGE